mgnify:CR=1 FL=1
MPAAKIDRPLLGAVYLVEPELSPERQRRDLENMAAAGFNLVVLDIKPEPVAALVKAGATAAKDLADLSKRCSIIITVLPTGKEVAEIV